MLSPLILNFKCDWICINNVYIQFFENITVHFLCRSHKLWHSNITYSILITLDPLSNRRFRCWGRFCPFSRLRWWTPAGSFVLADFSGPSRIPSLGDDPPWSRGIYLKRNRKFDFFKAFVEIDIKYKRALKRPIGVPMTYVRTGFLLIIIHRNHELDLVP